MMIASFLRCFLYERELIDVDFAEVPIRLPSGRSLLLGILDVVLSPVFPLLLILAVGWLALERGLKPA